jgi:hypothetical protein
VQLPADEHEIPLKEAMGSAWALPGAVISVAAAQVPDVSVAAIACKFRDVSTYAPAAVQLPADEHETPLSLDPPIFG